MDVLIADSSEFTRTLLREILEEDHRVVGEAENGVEAITFCEEYDPDLVTMEVAMPIQDGIEATAEITSSDSSASVLMCTSVEAGNEMERAFEAGAAGYVTKPFQRSNVVEAIEDAADG